MPKIHRGICPDKACELVDIEVKRQKSEREAFRVVANELGVSPNTVKSWSFRNKVGATAPAKIEPTPTHRTETNVTTSLSSLTYDSGRRKIIFQLQEADGNRLLAMQEYRVAAKGKETPTKNRLILPVDLIPQLRSALDQVEGMIREERLIEPNIDGLGSQKDDVVEPPPGGDGADTQEDEHDAMGAEIEPSPAPVYCSDTSRGAGLIRCKDCHRYAPGIQLKNREMKGNCQSLTLSWNGEFIQEPCKLHICKNFRGPDQQRG